jgi:hypothetical protein
MFEAASRHLFSLSMVEAVSGQPFSPGIWFHSRCSTCGISSRK